MSWNNPNNRQYAGNGYTAQPQNKWVAQWNSQNNVTAAPNNGMPPPPVDGAKMNTCQSGKNAGKRYWSVPGKWGKMNFYEWIDEVETLETRVKGMEDSLKQFLDFLAARETVEMDAKMETK
jgi:hypothetical protein